MCFYHISIPKNQLRSPRLGTVATINQNHEYPDSDYVPLRRVLESEIYRLDLRGSLEALLVVS